jgi:tetratricopeptide (TPR) repeat protein
MLKLRRTFGSVVRELASGLSEGSIVIRRPDPRAESGEELLLPLIDVSVDLSALTSETDDASLAALTQDITEARHRGDRRAEMLAQVRLGRAFLRERQYANARRHLTYARGIASEQDLIEPQLEIITDIGVIDLATGEVRQASMLFEEAFVLSRQVENKRAECAVLTGMGAAYSRLGHLGKAISALSAAASIAEDLGDAKAQGISLQNLGNCYVRLGKLTLARDTFEARIALAQSIQDLRGVASGLGNLAVVLFARGDQMAAVDLFHRQLDLAEEIGDEGLREMALQNLAHATMQLKINR